MADIRNCEYCKIEFTTNPSRKKRFCSIPCSSKRIISKEHREKNSIANKGKIISQEQRVKISKSSIGKRHSELSKMKMSETHKKIGSIKNLTPFIGQKHTEKSKEKIRAALTGKPKSKKHIENIMLSRPRGKNHSAWRGGITPENTKIRRSDPGRKWIKNVFIRDNFSCKKCNKNGDLNAHHIFNFSEYPDLRLDIKNGITFCVPCHKYFHSKFGKNTTNVHLEEFLNV